MNPRVKKVKVLQEYNLLLTFTNNQQKIYNCSNLLDFGVFQAFRNYNFFKQVKANHGTVVWPNEIDICPDTLYLDSIEV